VRQVLDDVVAVGGAVFFNVSRGGREEGERLPGGEEGVGLAADDEVGRRLKVFAEFRAQRMGHKVRV